MRKFFQNESGATAIEYGLIAALVAAVIVGAVGRIGVETAQSFEEVATALETDGGDASGGAGGL